MGYDSLYHDTARTELRPLHRRTDGEAAAVYGILSGVKLTETKGYTNIIHLRRSFQKFCTLRLRGQYDDAIVLIFATVVSQSSVKNNVCILAGYVVPVPQNGALKWKKKLTGVISRSGQRSYINTRSHASGAVSEILEKHGWQVLPHPPYSPDMSPPAVDLFQN